MGQFWKVINLDKKQAFNDWGKMGEFLFYGVPNCLNKYLATPKNPPIDSLIRPYPGRLYRHRRQPWTGNTATQNSRFVNLPEDILREIYANLEEFVEVIFVSMTCQALWALGRHIAYQRIVAAAHAICWSGNRILCAGDYLDNDDIPEGLLSPGEKELLLTPSPGRGDDDDGSEDCTLFTYPYAKQTRKTDPSVCSSLWYSSADRMRAKCMSTRSAAALWAALRTHADLFYDFVEITYDSEFVSKEELRSPGSVLRNFSKHEYVRQQAILDLHARYADSELRVAMERISFAEVLFPRICLSSDPGMSLNYLRDRDTDALGLHRGSWAGDRFDVLLAEEGEVWLNDLNGAKDGLPWTDVSDEVLGLVEEIWVAELH
ncbi:hypothetical protein C8F01DRAFT_126922 [Mycena amicta]|nr:hypothetical protein C8F01DRAFT_126922 [Mycena amicta]